MYNTSFRLKVLCLIISWNRVRKYVNVQMCRHFFMHFWCIPRVISPCSCRLTFPFIWRWPFPCICKSICPCIKIDIPSPSLHHRFHRLTSPASKDLCSFNFPETIDFLHLASLDFCRFPSLCICRHLSPWILHFPPLASYIFLSLYPKLYLPLIS